MKLTKSFKEFTTKTKNSATFEFYTSFKSKSRNLLYLFQILQHKNESQKHYNQLEKDHITSLKKPADVTFKLITNPKLKIEEFQPPCNQFSLSSNTFESISILHKSYLNYKRNSKLVIFK